MKTWEQIKRLSDSTDYNKVAKIAGCSPKNVRLVSDGKRPDNFQIQKIFSEYLTCLQRLARKYNRKPTNHKKP